MDLAPLLKRETEAQREEVTCPKVLFGSTEASE